MGPPPIMTTTSSLSPESFNISITTFILSIVVVIKVDIPTNVAFVSFTLFMNSIGGTSLPRSCTSKPQVSSIILNKFLPMSWVSPSTTPTTALCFIPLEANFR